MAVTIEQVTSPLGEIDPAVLFPGETPADFAFRMSGYITAAYVTAPGDDDFAYNWAHYRAYNDALMRMAFTPASAQLPEGGKYTFTDAQIAIIEAARNRFWALVRVVLFPLSASGWGSALVLRGS